MSALAGIFKTDRRNPVESKELLRLAGGIDRFGPDRGGDYASGNIGMSHRALFTTPEAHFEEQPLTRANFTLTWTGRLDNREEIRLGLSDQFPDTQTDLELILAAFRKWGLKALPQFEGDWALALWDAAEHKLVLARDCFGVRPLYYLQEPDRISWCSVLEPLALNSKIRLSLDEKYLAGCICPYPQLGTTPYKEIKAVLPAHFIEFYADGKQRSERYWSLDPKTRIRYRRDADYEEHFRELIRASVRKRLRSDRPALCELSGGVDSSSIVCLGRDIERREGGPEIATISYFDPDEPSGDERPFISAVEEHIGRGGHHISMAEFNQRTHTDAINPLPEEYFCARPGYFRRFLYWDQAVAQIQEKANARVILSGFGGDEFLGGVQYEALGLLEHLLAGNFLSFARSTFDWSMARRKPIAALIGQTLQLAFARHALDRFVKPSGPPAWALWFPPQSDSVLHNFSAWRSLSPAHLCAEMTRYSVTSLLSCIDPPLVGVAEVRYPYLDRALFSFMAAIPREQVIRPRERRSLMRRSLRGLVPDRILYRKTKWFGHREAAAFLRDQSSNIEQLFQTRWLSQGSLVNVPLIQKRIQEVQHGAVSEARQITSAIGVELWLRDQQRRGVDAHLRSASQRQKPAPVTAG